MWLSDSCPKSLQHPHQLHNRPMAWYSCNICHRHQFPSCCTLSIHQSKDKACQWALQEQFERKHHSAEQAEIQQHLDGIISLPDIIDIDFNNTPESPLVDLPLHDTCTTAMESYPPAISTQDDVDTIQPALTVGIEDVEDEGCDSRQQQCYMQEFPEEKEAGATYGHSQTLFKKIHDETVLRWGEVLGPFKDDDEWEFAKWIIKHVGHNAADKLLWLNMVCQCALFPLIDYSPRVESIDTEWSQAIIQEKGWFSSKDWSAPWWSSLEFTVNEAHWWLERC